MTLKQAVEKTSPNLYGGLVGHMDLAFTNVDDFFAEFVKQGIKELDVTKDELLFLARFYIANVSNDKNGNQGKVLKEGKINKLFGIKLHAVNS